ncbi:MAG: prolyl oligopeptidase family serine peptidase [Myxococcota bacterium]
MAPAYGKARPGTRATLVLALALAGCSSRPPAVQNPPAPKGAGAMIHELNAAARQQGVVETRHGLEIADPFRALEEDSPLTRRWMRLQTARTEKVLGPYAMPALRERLETLLSIGVLGEPAVAGERVFYTKREGERERPVLLLARDGQPSEGPLVDPLAYGDRAALDWFYPSPDGTRVAFGISHAGDERSVLHILDVDSGRTLPDRIERTKWTQLAWLPDGSGFYYTRYPAPGEPDHDPDHPDSYFQRVFFHRVGSDPADDVRVFGSDRGTDFPSVDVSDDGRWLVITVFRGWSRSDVYLLDRGPDGARRVTPDDTHPLEPVTVGRDAVTVGRVHRGTLYLQTNEGAPRGRIAAVDPPHAADRDRWRDVVAERPDATLEDWALAGGRLVVHHVQGLQSRLTSVALDGGGAPVEVALPGPGTVSGLAAGHKSGRLAFGFSSYLHAPTLLAQASAEKAPAPIDRVRHDVDLDRYALTVERVRSADGTRVPVQLVHAKGLRRDGTHPVLLTGYGGFDRSLLPTFTRHALHWLERGGVYAVANLRGGGEHGEAWHRAGMRENKPRVFEDFEAVLRWLTDGGISRPERIVVTGRSNGGLLVGAALTRAPDAFAAAASYVGLYDMVRFDRFPPAELWVSEYGDPDDPAELRVLHGYSPYHQVREGVAYPAVLLEAADRDSRVHWAHSTKLAARLQEATASDAPVLYYQQEALGHGAGTGRSDLVDQYTRMYAFFDRVLDRR